MNYRETLSSAICLLAFVGISKAFFAPRIYGLSEDPCGPTLEVYRRMGVVPRAPKNPPNATTAVPKARRVGQPLGGYYQMSRYAMMSSYDAPDLPDIPTGIHAYPGMRGAGGPGAQGLYPPGPPMECRCDSGIECQPLGGSAHLRKYAHECNREMGLVCCCSTG